MNLDINKLKRQVQKYLTIRLYIMIIFVFIVLFAFNRLIMPTAVLIALLVGALLIHDAIQTELINNGKE